MSSDLIEIKKESALEVFTKPDGLKYYLDLIATEARAIEPDITSTKGRKEIASTAHKVAKLKTYIDGVGKELVADLKELPKKIDASRKEARDFLDSLKDEVRAPLDEWEKEQARIEAERLAEQQAQELAKQVAIDHEIALLMNDVHDREQEDRAKRAEQERIERENQIRQEAEQKAKQDAERQIAEANLLAEQAIERAAQAVEDERKRVALEDARQKADEAKRNADKDHQRTINRAALEDLINHTGLTRQQAMDVVVAIASGKIANVSIKY